LQEKENYIDLALTPNLDLDFDLTWAASTSSPSLPDGIMEDEVIEDCIVVADNAISTFSNKATSESNGNDHDGFTDDAAAQEKDPGEINKPYPPPQAPMPQTQFNQMSPTKVHKAQSQVRRRPRSKFQRQFDGEDDCDYDPSEDSDDSLSDVSEPLESRFNLRSKETRKQQVCSLLSIPFFTLCPISLPRTASDGILGGWFGKARWLLSS
jgi:hypothetical protein